MPSFQLQESHLKYAPVCQGTALASKVLQDLKLQGVQSSNVLSFCVKNHISALVSSKTFFFHPDIVQPKYEVILVFLGTPLPPLPPGVRIAE